MMAKACEVDHCDNPVLSRGMCKPHYNRWRKTGSCKPEQPLRNKNHAAERWLIAHADFCGDDCLTWPFKRDEWGRGRLTIGGKKKIASRVICEIAHGAPPSSSHHAAHSCGRGHEACVNPRHLRWAVPKDNCEDKKQHGTYRLGEKCHTSKISDAVAAEILALKGGSESQYSIAARYGVHQSTVSDLWRGKRRSWMGETQ